MVVIKLWPVLSTYVLAEWQGRGDGGYVMVRVKNGVLGLYENPKYHPVQADAVEIVEVEGYVAGLPATSFRPSAGGDPGPQAPRPTLPCYEAGGAYRHDWGYSRIARPGSASFDDSVSWTPVMRVGREEAQKIVDSQDTFATEDRGSDKGDNA